MESVFCILCQSIQSTDHGSMRSRNHAVTNQIAVLCSNVNEYHLEDISRYLKLSAVGVMEPVVLVWGDWLLERRDSWGYIGRYLMSIFAH